MITLIILLAIIVFLLFTFVMAEFPSFRAMYILRKMHGPRGLPIVGCILELRSLSGPDIMDFLTGYSIKYPRLTSFYVGGVSSVMMHDAEDIQVILGSINHIKKGKEYDFLLPWLKEGLLTSYGDKWQARRKLLTPTFHFKILEDSINYMNTNITKFVKRLADSAGKPVIIDDYTTECALDIIGETSMGIKLEAQNDAGKTYVKSIKDTGECMIKRLIRVWYFREWTYKLSYYGRKFFKSVNFLHRFTEKVIKERKQLYEVDKVKFSDPNEPKKKVRLSFLDCLLETQRNQPNLLTDLDIREEVDTIMFEGHDTTASAITFALWLLGRNLEQQDKVVEELEEIFGNEERDITMSDIHKMEYTDKVIKETLRLYPSVPYISRRLTQDCELADGTILPYMSNVIILPFIVHRNPRFFPDPEKFDPERFSEENATGRHPFCYIPFSAGPRNCIGQRFAMIEMKITLAKILRKLKVTAVTRPDEFKILPYLIIRPTVPIKVKFSLRKNKLS